MTDALFTLTVAGGIVAASFTLGVLWAGPRAHRNGFAAGRASLAHPAGTARTEVECALPSHSGVPLIPCPQCVRLGVCAVRELGMTL